MGSALIMTMPVRWPVARSAVNSTLPGNRLHSARRSYRGQGSIDIKGLPAFCFTFLNSNSCYQRTSVVRSMEDISVEDRFYLSDGYKRSVLEHMSLPQLLDTLLIHATVYISPSYRDTGLTASYSFKPLSNLVYTRDQQVSGHIANSLQRPKHQKFA